MESKLELGKDYIFTQDVILTSCYINNINDVGFVYKNNDTPKNNILLFGDGNPGSNFIYFSLSYVLTLKKSHNNYTTNIEYNKEIIGTVNFRDEITSDQILTGEILNKELIITSNKEDGIIGEYWYDVDRKEYVQQVYPSIYVYQGIRRADGTLYSFFDTGTLRKVSVEEMKEFFNKINKPMKKRFICPVSMECTEEQYINDLKEPLLNMGYEESYKTPMNAVHNILVTNYEGSSGCISNVLNNRIHAEDRYFISEYNPKLFLALAAMTNDENGNYGEYWKYVGTTNLSFTTDEIYKQGGTDGMYSVDSKYFKKATKEEIIKHFKKEQTMEKFTISRSDMQLIYNIACSSWQPKITALTKTYADSVFGDTITLPKEKVEEMFKAASATQLKTLKLVFPNYSKEGDKNVFIKDPTSDQVHDLNNALEALIPNYRVEMAKAAPGKIGKPELTNRALYVSSFIKVIVHDVEGSSIIEFVAK